jgi:hypothetical protein
MQAFYQLPSGNGHIKSMAGIFEDVDLRADGGITVLYGLHGG